MPRASKALTPKQRAFVDEYLIDLNGTASAIRAGFSHRSAKAKASQLLAMEHVAAAIASAQQDRSERTKIDADWVLTRLAQEADADLADLYASDGSLKLVQDWPEIWRKGLVAGLDVEEVKQEGVVVALVKKLKLSDRIKRIELIGKHVNVQAFRDQVGVGNPDGTPIMPPVIQFVKDGS